MEADTVLPASEKIPASWILDRSRFGRSGLPVLWVNSRNLQPLARGLGAEPDLRIDWIENFSVTRMGPSLVVTYFLRSTTKPSQIILRCAIELPDGEIEVKLPSVREIWPMAAMMEDQAGELYGIEFLSVEGTSLGRKASLLPEGFTETRGFPMRRDGK